MTTFDKDRQAMEAWADTLAQDHIMLEADVERKEIVIWSQEGAYVSIWQMYGEEN